MDIKWGSKEAHAFITNVGLITSNGPNGQNIMAAEFTHLISYSPGLIAVCIRSGKATHDNIHASKEFGVNIASLGQNVLSSISGGSTGKEYNKIKALEELGYKFHKGKKIGALMVEGAKANFECKLMQELTPGSHTIFIGEVVEATVDGKQKPIAYSEGQYGTVHFDITKSSDEEKQKQNEVLAKNKK
ncbi:MAG: flavin reductase family protein [Candidatus Diapherotrites archaeon]|nr:flavin reductase family protein [Candidatus Diapherotrites archaeon]